MKIFRFNLMDILLESAFLIGGIGIGIMATNLFLWDFSIILNFHIGLAIALLGIFSSIYIWNKHKENPTNKNQFS